MTSRPHLTICRKPPINVPYKHTFGAPDQGQMLDVWKSQITESALRWQTRHIAPRHNLGCILGCGLGVLWTGSWIPWPHLGTITHDLTQDPSIDSLSFCRPFLKLKISFLDYKYHLLTTTPYPCGLNLASYLTSLVSLRLAWRPSTQYANLRTRFVIQVQDSPSQDFFPTSRLTREDQKHSYQWATCEDQVPTFPQPSAALNLQEANSDNPYVTTRSASNEPIEVCPRGT